MMRMGLVLMWAANLLLFAATTEAATRAGEGDHRFFVLKREGAPTTDRATPEVGIHYIAVDAVRWFVNRQGNWWVDRQASGAAEVLLNNNEKYEIGLGTYELDQGARTAPVFKRPVLDNRVFLGGRLTLTVFVKAIEKHTLLGELLRNMSVASLNVVSGAIATATATGPQAALLAAGSSLTGGVKSILEKGSRPLTIFDPGGASLTIDLTTLTGPENYILIHRGAALQKDRFAIKADPSGSVDVHYNGAPLDDGAWILFLVRRESTYGQTRPWYENARRIRADLDQLMRRWRSGGVTKDEVQKELTPQGSTPPTLADRIFAEMYIIQTDFVLAEKEGIREAGDLEARLMLAREAVKRDTVAYYFDELTKMESRLNAGMQPQTLPASAFTKAASELIRVRQKARADIKVSPILSVGAGQEQFWKAFSDSTVKVKEGGRTIEVLPSQAIQSPKDKGALVESLKDKDFTPAKDFTPDTIFTPRRDFAPGKELRPGKDLDIRK